MDCRSKNSEIDFEEGGIFALMTPDMKDNLILTAKFKMPLETAVMYQLLVTPQGVREAGTGVDMMTG
jgi:hypothetical protein